MGICNSYKKIHNTPWSHLLLVTNYAHIYNTCMNTNTLKTFGIEYFVNKID